MDCSRTKYDSALLKKIGSYVCQTVIFIHEQQPDLLLEKYRNIPWHSSRNQENLAGKLIKMLRIAVDWQALLKQLRKFLQALLTPNSFESPILVTLLAKINRLNPNKDELNSPKLVNNGSTYKSNYDDSIPDTLDDYKSFNCVKNNHPEGKYGMAILLLDAEKLQLSVEAEKFLHQVSNYQLQVKIAFANWQSMGKKDIELHQRGYDLIHVPASKDTADDKIIAFGVSLPKYYSQVQEVFVCSGDHVMTRLCNQLQKNGILVYHVSQKANNIKVINTQKNEVQMYSIVPSIEKVLHQVKEIITIEANRNINQWIKLSRISKIFAKKYLVDINEVVSHHFPGKTAKDIFAENSDLVLHYIPDKNETYVALFKMPHNSKIKMKNQSDLEQILVKIVSALVTKTTHKYIPIDTLSGKFHQKYGQPVSKVMEKLDLDANFLGFLHSCDSFTLQKIGDRWQVSLKGDSRVKASA
ncbi:NYN domain-containing protein [Calothrix rhizosoleniae]|uniref:NYN domain-containing protein n=1 Tax=Calothrix rhizosoleniae TaxID=888997 RepID=UPI000B4A1D1B|nr:NYN domain-containing protein [Calothrix rhizosoleniae]